MIYAITNQKGGVGKTTTAAALATGLKMLKKNVLAIDLDAQCNLTDTLGASRSASILNVLLGEKAIEEAIQHTESTDIIASSKALVGADKALDSIGKENKLKEALEPIKDKYDFIIIDTPPALNVLTVNALAVADKVIIPAEAALYSIQGFNDLLENIEPVKKYFNPSLEVAGVLITKYKTRSTICKEATEVLEKLAERAGTKVFKAKIRDTVAVNASVATGQSIYDYNPKGNAAIDYKEFIKELLK